VHAALMIAARTTLIALLLLPLFPSPSAAAQDRDESLVCLFDSGVEDYVQIHRRLERFVPPEVITRDPYMLFVSRWALAADIRRARPLARQGDIFTPELAAMFRRIVARALRDDEIGMTVFLAEDGMTLPIDVRVNGDYPAGGPVTTMPPTLLKALPALPPELQYRFVNFNLILWDVHAGLIVDFVPDVFRRTTVP
jgi:hypothetical protein